MKLLCWRKSEEARALILQRPAISFLELRLLFGRHGQFQSLPSLQFKRDKACDDWIRLHLRIHVRRIGDGVCPRADDFCDSLLNGRRIVCSGHPPFADALPNRTAKKEDCD